MFHLQKRRKTKAPELPPVLRDKLKKAFLECQKQVMICEDDTGRKRCELFKDVPDRKVSALIIYFFQEITNDHNSVGLPRLLSVDKTTHLAIADP